MIRQRSTGRLGVTKRVHLREEASESWRIEAFPGSFPPFFFHRHAAARKKRSPIGAFRIIISQRRA